jgi:Ca2+-transporting ATPase
VFPALALGMGKGEEGIMKQLPRNPKEPIITTNHWISAGVYGLSITIAVIGITIYAHYVMEATYQVVNNMAFYTLVLAQLLNVFNIPHREFSFFKNEVTTNAWIWGALALSIVVLVLANIIPVLERVLSLVLLTSQEFFIICVFGLGTLVISQSLKRLGATL